MLKLLSRLLKEGVVTDRGIPETLAIESRGLPDVMKIDCADECVACSAVCPSGAIEANEGRVQIDLGTCITCSLCIEECPSNVIVESHSSNTIALQRKALVVENVHAPPVSPVENKRGKATLKYAAACRVVSTGCSACDMEVAACSNSIFDMERFGITVVASPRFADILLVTGPAPKSMHEALRSCFAAMPEPKKVIAVGTCAISGGVHAGGYAQANGITSILPVAGFIPGCPPHPWSIISGIRSVMNLDDFESNAK